MRYTGEMASPKHKIKLGCYEPIKLGKITLNEGKRIALENQPTVYLFRYRKMRHLFTSTGDHQQFED